MSYRMYVKNEIDGKRYQFLGNNECPEVLIEELKKQGAEFDEDYCIRNFEIKDIQAVITALEKYILDTYEYQKQRGNNIFDFEEKILKEKEQNLTFYLDYAKDCWYMLTSVNFVNAIKDSIDIFYKDKMIYEIKPDKHVYIDAF